MSDSIFLTGPLLYRFEFGCDGKIYSTQFTGELSPKADTEILRETRRHPLEESSEIIWSFLEHNQIDYSHFTSSIKILEHAKIMEQADFLRLCGSGLNVIAHVPFKRIKAHGLHYCSMRLYAVILGNIPLPSRTSNYQATSFKQASRITNLFSSE